jgi:hypothetical protein
METILADVLRVFQRHIDRAFDEAIAVVSGELDQDGVGYDEELGLTEDEIKEIADALAADDAVWKRTGEEPDVSWRWPDGNVDTYRTFTTYRCEGGPYAGLNLALGVADSPSKGREIVGFVLGTGGGSRRPLTVFFPDGDFETSRERLSMIRGKGGGNSRKGYAPDEPLPSVYGMFNTDVLGRRIPGKWNVQAVVVTDDADGEKAMLNHTAIQARLRGIA